MQRVLFLTCSIPRTEFSCITTPVAYAATHYSNPMPTQTQAFSLPRNKRYSLPVIIVGSSPESCIIVANMDDKFFLQTSPDTYPVVNYLSPSAVPKAVSMLTHLFRRTSEGGIWWLHTVGRDFGLKRCRFDFTKYIIPQSPAQILKIGPRYVLRIPFMN